jgi:hypothetical protein
VPRPLTFLLHPEAWPPWTRSGGPARTSDKSDIARGQCSRSIKPRGTPPDLANASPHMCALRLPFQMHSLSRTPHTQSHSHTLFADNIQVPAAVHSQGMNERPATKNTVREICALAPTTQIRADLLTAPPTQAPSQNLHTQPQYSTHDHTPLHTLLAVRMGDGQTNSTSSEKKLNEWPRGKHLQVRLARPTPHLPQHTPRGRHFALTTPDSRFSQARALRLFHYLTNKFLDRPLFQS